MFYAGKLNVISEFFFNFRPNFQRSYIFAYSFFIIDGKMIVCVFLFHITGAFLLYARSVTRNLSTYFTSLGRVFLVETIIL